MHDEDERIDTVLGAMAGSGPRNLRAYLGKPAPDFDQVSESDIDDLLARLLAADANSTARLRFSIAVRAWDNAKDAKWVNGTARNTHARRRLILDLLHADDSLCARIDALIPFYAIEEPLIIAERHEDWYKPENSGRDYYWKTYKKYLTERKSWSDQAVLNLDNSTRAILECFADPESQSSYSSRGLVVGYVQSGKTANFTGVISRAAEAGYRLIIVLAGTWNLLRNQTQRRLDKELLGKELLSNDDGYMEHPPADWGDFLEHGANPKDIGQYIWQRLTRPEIDFKRLKAAIDNLEFEKAHQDAPLFDARNLHSLPTKLLVIKKHSGILASLVKDLKLVRTKLVELPTLIIDDESDQAGLDTRDPQKRKDDGTKNRTPTNAKLVELLGLFPRGQYVGYTATPYANVLVDPNDDEDLFPKDFIVPLERPIGYMGILDFFDPDTAYEDLDKADFSLPEVAFIRRVTPAPGDDDDDIKAALRSYLLAGAIKLYRQGQYPDLYRPAHFRHHTMLVHTSARTGDQRTLSERLKQLWLECAFNTPNGLSDLEKLWQSDHYKVITSLDSEKYPDEFKALIPHLSESIKKIESGPEVFLLVNSDKKDAPDFSASSVWKIMIGGNKLSRGYTIEGLTVSYYRRVAGTAETLMQMGRWFGFRPGYQDLVRVFLGVDEGRKKEDLVASFKEVCRMEERFREQLHRYFRKEGSERITPRQIPPLVIAAGELPPTARNKMYNAFITDQNFSGQLSMHTLAPAGVPAMDNNLTAAHDLLDGAEYIGKRTLGGKRTAGTNVAVVTQIFEATNELFADFLAAYQWLESDFAYPDRPVDALLQIEFLRKQAHGIKSWLIMAPQRKVSFGDPDAVGRAGTLAVKERHRAGGRGFQVFGEPDHRALAHCLVGLKPKSGELTHPNAETKALCDEHRGICLLYPVRENPNGKITIGFELLFPKNDLGFETTFSVRVKARPKDIVVRASA